MATRTITLRQALKEQKQRKSAKRLKKFRFQSARRKALHERSIKESLARGVTRSGGKVVDSRTGKERNITFKDIDLMNGAGTIKEGMTATSKPTSKNGETEQKFFTRKGNVLETRTMVSRGVQREPFASKEALRRAKGGFQPLEDEKIIKSIIKTRIKKQSVAELITPTVLLKKRGLDLDKLKPIDRDKVIVAKNSVEAKGKLLEKQALKEKKRSTRILKGAGAIGLLVASNLKNDVVNTARILKKVPSKVVTSSKNLYDLTKTKEGRAEIKRQTNDILKKSKNFQKIGIATVSFIKKNLSDQQIKAVAEKNIAEFKRTPATKTAGLISLLINIAVSSLVLTKTVKLTKVFGRGFKRGAKSLIPRPKLKPKVFLTEAQKKLSSSKQKVIIKAKQKAILKTQAKFKAFTRQERRMLAVKKAINFDRKLSKLPLTIQRIIKKKIKNLSPVQLKNNFARILKESRIKRLKTKAIKRTRAKLKKRERIKKIKALPNIIRSAIRLNVERFSKPIKRRITSFKDFFRTITVKPEQLNLQISDSQLKSLARLREQQSKSRLLLSKVENINDFIKIPIDKTFTVNNIRNFVNFLKSNRNNWKFVIVQETKDFLRVVIDGKNVLVKLTLRPSKLLKTARKGAKVGTIITPLKKGLKPKTKQFFIGGQKIEIIESGIPLAPSKAQLLLKNILKRTKTQKLKKALPKKTIKHSAGKGQIQILKIEPVKKTVVRQKLKQLQQVKQQLRQVQKIKPSVAQSQLVMPIQLRKQEQQLKQQLKQSQTSKQKQKVSLLLLQNQLQKLKQIQKQITKQSLIQSSVLSLKSILSTVQALAVAQSSKQAVLQSVAQLLKSASVLLTKQITKPVKKLMVTPKLKLNWEQKLPKGFNRIVNVVIRIKGKNKEFQLKTTPNRALRQVTKLVDNATNRSFQLKIIGYKKIKDIKKPNLTKFRMKKSKGTPVLRIVEKTKHAIDTKGEKQGLRISKIIKKRK